MCRDVSFYGNKLFQSTFISIIAPGSSILTGLLWTLLNSFVALVRARPLRGSCTIYVDSIAIRPVSVSCGSRTCG